MELYQQSTYVTINISRHFVKAFANSVHDTKYHNQCSDINLCKILTAQVQKHWIELQSQKWQSSFPTV